MTGPKQRLIVDGVEFASVFRFPRILRAVTAALQPPRLVLALLMVVILIAAGRSWDAFSEPRIHPGGLVAGAWSIEERHDARNVIADELKRAGLADGQDVGALDAASALLLLDATYRSARADGTAPDGYDDAAFLAARARLHTLRPRGPYEASVAHVAACFEHVVRGVVELRPGMIITAGRDLFVELPRTLWRQERGFAIFYGLLTLVVVSLGGGAVCRMAACDFAGHERLRISEATTFVLDNWVKLLLTPMLPLLIAGGLALAMIIGGVLLLPWLDVIGGLLYGLALIAGFLLVFVLLGYAVGFPLLLPAVACENCDAADAQQRAFGYVLSRPLHLLGYVVVMLVGLALGYVVVALFATTIINFTATLVGVIPENSALLSAGGVGILDLAPSDAGAVHDAWHSRWAAAMITFWQRVVVDLVIAWVVSYLFTASTIVYLLMRRAADGQDVEEIWRPGLTPGTLVPLPDVSYRAEDTGDTDTEASAS
ncbi:MAG: hypothetical protein GY715_16515 [Planctomycetes bacterium]|nr:hypothetical protein [Planctomycetota bacterium]